MDPEQARYALLLVTVVGVGTLIGGAALRAARGPSRLTTGTGTLTTPWLLIGLGALLATTGATLVAVIPDVLRDRQAMLAAVEQFVAVVRTGDMAAVRKATAPGAQLDDAFLLAQVRPSEGLSYGSSASDSVDGCVEVVLLPRRSGFFLYLVRGQERWLVKRALQRDDECDERTDD